MQGQSRKETKRPWLPYLFRCSCQFGAILKIVGHLVQNGADRLHDAHNDRAVQAQEVFGVNTQHEEDVGRF